ncbi:hypothetical protein ACHAWF_003708, partial [Thalassiosira exigua]
NNLNEETTNWLRQKRQPVVNKLLIEEVTLEYGITSTEKASMTKIRVDEFYPLELQHQRTIDKKRETNTQKDEANTQGRESLEEKSDIKAYRRHAKPDIAATCMTAWFTNKIDEDGQTREDFIGRILTRRPFGQSPPAPPEFLICSEIICNIGNDLLHCPK